MGMGIGGGGYGYGGSYQGGYGQPMRGGFGDVRGEFWAGNDLISQLTALTPSVLRVHLGAHNGSSAVAEYSTFRFDQILTENIPYFVQS